MSGQNGHDQQTRFSPGTTISHTHVRGRPRPYSERLPHPLGWPFGQSLPNRSAPRLTCGDTRVYSTWAL
jgi:hypothetical protein